MGIANAKVTAIIPIAPLILRTKKYVFEGSLVAFQLSSFVHTILGAITFNNDTANTTA